MTKLVQILLTKELVVNLGKDEHGQQNTVTLPAGRLLRDARPLAVQPRSSRRRCVTAASLDAPGCPCEFRTPQVARPNPCRGRHALRPVGAPGGDTERP